MNLSSDYLDMGLRLIAASRVVIDPTRMAQGIMTGIGFLGAGLGTVLTLGTLSVFRWIEGRMPSEFYANFHVRFPRSGVMPEEELRRLIAEPTVTEFRIAPTGD